MAERKFPGFILRSSAVLESARYKALISSSPVSGGFPTFYTVYDNRSFRDGVLAAEAAEKALGLVQGVDDDGAPIFDENETGFDDDKVSDETDHDPESDTDSN